MANFSANESSLKGKSVSHDLLIVIVFEKIVPDSLCSRNFQNVKLRPKNEFLFKCGKRIILPLRFYVKSILAEFESQKQPFENFIDPGL